jgi:transposase
MLREDVVREVLARLEQGQKVKRIARELGVTVKTVKRWRRRGQWRPRQAPARQRAIDTYAEFIRRRAPEVGWNGVVVHRELRTLGFRGGYLQVQRFLQPLRSERRWASIATMRFETEPGRQAQVDFGQRRLWIADTAVTAHIFVISWVFRGASGRGRTRTSGWRRSSTRMSGRSSTSAACRSNASPITWRAT